MSRHGCPERAGCLLDCALRAKTDCLQGGCCGDLAGDHLRLYPRSESFSLLFLILILILICVSLICIVIIDIIITILQRHTL